MRDGFAGGGDGPGRAPGANGRELAMPEGLAGREGLSFEVLTELVGKGGGW